MIVALSHLVCLQDIFRKRGNVARRRVHKATLAAKKYYYVFFCVDVGAQAWTCACAHVALLIQHATPSEASLILSYFLT
jgi:hypothetical protein